MTNPWKRWRANRKSWRANWDLYLKAVDHHREMGEIIVLVSQYKIKVQNPEGLVERFAAAETARRVAWRKVRAWNREDPS